MSQQSFLTSEAAGLLKNLGAARSTEERQAVIAELARQASGNVSRVLIEIFEYCMWRSTKVVILRSLGLIGDERAREFLIRFLRDQDDLPLAQMAVQALGASQQTAAGEYLVAIAEMTDHPLQIAAIMGLADMPLFPCEAILCRLLRSDAPTDRLVEAVITAMGRRRDRLEPGLLYPFLTSKWSSRVRHATIMTLGRVGDENDLLVLNESSNLDFMARELLIDARENISRRTLLPLDDAILRILECDQSALRDHGIRLLKDLARTVNVTLKDIDHELPANLKLTARAAFFDPAGLESDLALVAQSEGCDIESATLLKLHGQHAPQIWERLAKLNQATAVRLAQHLLLPNPVKDLEPYIKDPSLPESTRIQAINALVWQALMRPHPVQIGCEDFFLKLLYREGNETLQTRVIRALGQLGEGKANLQKFVEKKIGDEAFTRSCLAALPQIPQAWALKLVAKQLENLLSSGGANDAAVVEHIKSLARFSRIDQADVLIDLPERYREPSSLDLLKILTQVKIAGFEPMVVKFLHADDYQHRILAIAAAKNFGLTWPHWESLLNESDVSIRGRALDAVCHSLPGPDQGKFLNWLRLKIDNKDTMLQVLTKLQPDATFYSAWTAVLKEWQGDPHGIFTDEKLRDACQAFGNKLEILKRHKSLDRGLDSHSVDSQLKELLPDFEALSRPAKSALRNAELTWANPNLFDESVDRSTMIVQYTKSIDLFLQEKVGTMLFSENAGIMQKLQSRVIRYGLESEMSSVEIMERLSIKHCFTSDQFPAHKLLSIVQSISSGRLMRDQYRTIDGVRAWSIILLLFARKFDYQGSRYEPLLQCQTPDNQRMSWLCSELNRLQEFRNVAAHRGTSFLPQDLNQIRQDSIKLFRLLHEAMVSQYKRVSF